MKKLLAVTALIAAFLLSNWLWFRAGRSYGRNEMIGAMTLRVKPPPAPYSDVAFLFGEPEPGAIDASTKIHFQYRYISSADGWTIKNLFIDEANKVIDGCHKGDQK